ncbi:MAG: hypothetical protein RL397_985 [Pseudomonadota bacterium]
MTIAVIVVGLSLAILIGPALAQQPRGDQVREQERLRDDAPIYGSQMMTDRERNEYREKMRNAKTLKEQETIRSQHHDQMKERAKSRGMMLPDEPPARGLGNGPGSSSPGRSGAGSGGPGGGGPGGPGLGR